MSKPPREIPEQPIERAFAGLGALLGAVRDAGARASSGKCVRCGSAVETPPLRAGEAPRRDLLCDGCSETFLVGAARLAWRIMKR